MCFNNIFKILLYNFCYVEFSAIKQINCFRLPGVSIVSIYHTAINQNERFLPVIFYSTLKMYYSFQVEVLTRLGKTNII